MSRELTVILKQPESPPPLKFKKTPYWLEKIFFSPHFLIFFAALIATPIINLFTSTSESERRKVQEDAALIVPFLANLSDPEKFEVSKQALLALEEVSRDNDGKERPIFKAVRKTIIAVDVANRPRSKPSEGETKKLDEATKTKKPVTSLAVDMNTYEKLRTSLIYIQVDNNEVEKQQTADKIKNNLRNNMIIAPQVQKIFSSRMPEKTQVRYYHDSDQEKAEDLASIVSSLTKLHVYTVKPDLKAQEGTLELWLGKE